MMKTINITSSEENLKAIIAAGILSNPSFSSEVCGLGELIVTESEKQIIEEQMKWLSRAVERVYTVIQDHYEDAV